MGAIGVQPEPNQDLKRILLLLLPSLDSCLGVTRMGESVADEDKAK